MPFAYSTNNTCINCTDVVFQFKNFMTTASIAQGFTNPWLVVASSDGLAAPNLSGDCITKYSSGSGGLGNAGAWFVLRAPGGNPTDGYKEFCFQRVVGASNISTDADNLFRIKYTAKGFDLTSNLIAATRVPPAKSSSTANSGLDERIVLGSGTDALPVADYFVNSTYTSSGSTINLFAHFSAQTDGYGFYALSNRFSVPAGFFTFDPMLAGTYPAGANPDLDPYVTMVDNSSSILSADSVYTPNSKSTCYLRRGMSGEDGVRVQGFYPVLYDNCKIVGNLPSNPYNQKDDTFPLLYARKGSETSPNGYKGQSSLLKWHGQNRSNFSIVSIDTAGDRLVVGNVSIPWNNVPVST
jgi:hypothetical protein